MPSVIQIAFLACRLMALFLLAKILSNAGFVWLALLQLDSATSAKTLSPLAVQSFFDLLVVLFFWFGSRHLSRLIVGGDPPDKEGLNTFSQSTIFATAVAITGIFLLIHTLPNLISVLIRFPLQQAFYTHQILPPVLSLIMGSICLIGAKTIGEFVMRLRKR
jgi:hypothetical protein